MLAALDTLLPIVILIALGHAIARVGLISSGQWTGVERIGYFVLFPALFIETLAVSELSPSLLAGLGGALVFGVLTLTCVCFLARPLLARRLAMSGPAFTSFLQGSIRWNTLIPLGVIGGLYGSDGVAMVAIAVVALIPLINVINVLALVRYGEAHSHAPRGIARPLLTNPYILACIVGLALNLSGIVLPGPVLDSIAFLGQGALPLSLLVVGAGLDLSRLARPDATIALVLALKLLAMPVLMGGAALAMGLDSAALATALVVASAPAPPGAYLIAAQMGGDAPLMARIVTFQTLVSLITLPVVLWLLALLS